MSDNTDLKRRVAQLESEVRRGRRILGAGAVIALTAPLWLSAAPVGPLVDFFNGTVADADEVNDNFTALADAVDDNDARLGDLSTLLTDEQTSIVAALNEVHDELEAVAAAASSTLDDGLLAHFDMSSISGTTLIDQSGNGHDGNIIGGIEGNVVPGAVGFALDMANTGYVSLPIASAVSGGQARTVCIWVRATQGGGYAFGAGTSTPSLTFNSRFHPDGTPGFMGYSNDHDPTGGNDAINGDWHFLVYTYDGATVSVYLDDELEWSVGKSLNTGTNDVVIGRHNAAALYFPGALDEYRYYNRVLTGSERTLLFQERDPRPEIGGPTDGLLAAYDMSSISGTTLLDQSGLGNDGTIQGGVEGNAVGGIVGSAIDMANTGHVSLPQLSGVLGNRPRTVAIWVNATSGGGYAFGAGQNVANQTFNSRFHPDGTPGFMGYSNDHDPSGGTNAMDGTWHLVVYTYDGSTVTAYTDNALEWSVSKSLNTTTGVVIGRHNNATLYFPGYLDSYRYYNRVLSASERADLWNGGTGH